MYLLLLLFPNSHNSWGWARLRTLPGWNPEVGISLLSPMWVTKVYDLIPSSIVSPGRLAESRSEEETPGQTDTLVQDASVVHRSLIYHATILVHFIPFLWRVPSSFHLNLINVSTFTVSLSWVWNHLIIFISNANYHKIHEVKDSILYVSHRFLVFSVVAALLRFFPFFSKKCL